MIVIYPHAIIAKNIIQMIRPKKKHANEYSETSFWKKLSTNAKKAGVNVVYIALLLYYVMQDKNTPAKAKMIIASALGYFILPFDFIPDFIPGAGFTDDLGAMAFALQQVATHVTPQHKIKAKERLKKWFGTVDDEALQFIEQSL